MNSCAKSALTDIRALEWDQVPVTMPKRHRRSIIWDGLEYYWHFPQGRDWDHRSDLFLTIQLANAKGQVLRVFQESWPEVVPAFVATAIEEAILQGWRPEKSGPPFVLSRENRLLQDASPPTRNLETHKRNQHRNHRQPRQ